VGTLYVRQSDPVRHELQVMFSDRKPELSYLPAVAQGAWLGPFCLPGSSLFDRRQGVIDNTLDGFLMRAKKDQPPPDLLYFNQSRKRRRRPHSTAPRAIAQKEKAPRNPGRFPNSTGKV